MFAAGRLRLGDVERAVKEKRAVQSFDGRMAFILCWHFDKSETFGYPMPVVHDCHFVDFTKTGKQAPEHFLGYIPVQIADIDIQVIPPTLSDVYPILAHLNAADQYAEASGLIYDRISAIGVMSSGFKKNGSQK